MVKQQRKRGAGEQQKRGPRAGTRAARKDTSTRRRTDAPDESTRLWLDDMDSGISEDAAYDASGAATGGGVDTPTAVEKSDEAAVRKRKPIDQGSSAYTGGGADNGTNL